MPLRLLLCKLILFFTEVNLVALFFQFGSSRNNNIPNTSYLFIFIFIFCHLKFHLMKRIRNKAQQRQSPKSHTRNPSPEAQAQSTPQAQSTIWSGETEREMCAIDDSTAKSKSLCDCFSQITWHIKNQSFHYLFPLVSLSILYFPTLIISIIGILWPRNSENFKKVKRKFWFRHIGIVGRHQAVKLTMKY